MKISVCIAVHNDKSNIHYALDSVVTWVDEIVVVDGQSTDGTRDYLAAYNPKIKILSYPNVEMFHINKQKSLDAATSDWILQLDADEEVTPELREEILRIVTADLHVPFAYQIPRKNYFLGRFLMKGGVYPDYTIRLYRRGSMYFPCEDVHENVEPVKSMQPYALDGTWLGTTQSAMNHYSDPTFGRYMSRWHRYTRAEAVRLTELISSRHLSKVGYMWWLAAFTFKCIFVLPVVWFAKTYIRHLGIMDSWQGLVFHMMSALRWWGIIYEYYKLRILS